MNVSIILAHPDRNSLNHAIAEAAREALKENGYGIHFHDLYEEGFDPLLRTDEIPKGAGLPKAIELHCREIADARGIIIVHPNWWGQPPAILKGWVDRVIRPGVAYEFEEGDSGEGVPVGLLKAKAVLVFNTANTPEGREMSVFGDPLQLIWKNCIFDLCGVKEFYREMFRVVVTNTEDQRKEWLAGVKETVGHYFPSI